VLTSLPLKPAVQAAGGLYARMAEAGDNLSVGQAPPVSVGQV